MNVNTAVHEAIHKYYLPIYTVKAAQESDTPRAPYIKGQCPKILKSYFCFFISSLLNLMYVFQQFRLFSTPHDDNGESDSAVKRTSVNLAGSRN